MAQALRLGSQVTSIQPGSCSIAREDALVVQEVLGILGDEGVEVLTGAKPARATELSGQAVELETASNLICRK